MSVVLNFLEGIYLSAKNTTLAHYYFSEIIICTTHPSLLSRQRQQKAILPLRSMNIFALLVLPFSPCLVITEHRAQ